MADGTVVIGIELDTGDAESEAKAKGKQVGDTFAEEAASETDKLKKEIPDSVKDAGKKSKKPAGDGGEDAGEEFADKFKGAAKSGLAGLGGAIVGAIGVGAAIDAAFDSVDVANEFGEDMGKLEVAFSQAGYSVEDATETYRDFVGILGETDQSVEAVNHLAKLANSTEELGKWTNIAAGVYATFGDSLPLEGLTEAANETAKVGQVTGPLADALNWAGVSEDAFNDKLAQLVTEEERAAYITEILSGLYSDAGDAYMETNAAVVEYRRSQSDLNESVAGIGETLMPVVSALNDFAAGLIDDLQPVIQALVDNLPSLVDTFVDWLPVITGVAAGAAAFAVSLNFSAIAGVASTALAGVKTAVLGLNAALAANPVGAVVTAITVLVTALMTLWATNDEFRAAVTTAWEAIKQLAADVWGAVVQFFTVDVPNAINELVAWFSSLPEKISEFLDNALDNVAQFASNLWEEAKTAGRNLVDGIVDTVTSLPDRMLEIGENLVRGLWNGILNAKNWLFNQIGGFVDSVVGGFMDMFGIHSPSTVMRDKVGKYLAEGVGVGFQENNPVKDIERSLLSDVTSIGMSARLSVASGTTTNYFTIERIDAHDMQGIDNVNALVRLFEMNA